MTPRIKSDMTVIASRRVSGGPLMYPGVWQRVWISIPGTGVWFLAGMTCTPDRGGAA